MELLQDPVVAADGFTYTPIYYTKTPLLHQNTPATLAALLFQYCFVTFSSSLFQIRAPQHRAVVCARPHQQP